MDPAQPRQAADRGAEEPPLCFDLDGTLIAGDSLKISLLRLAVRQPWRLVALPFSMVRGRAWFKKRVADAILPDPRRLPYRPAVIAFLADERRRRRQVIMVTAADQRIGALVAEHLGSFDAVIGSDGRTNVKGPLKLDAIRRYLGGGEFDYVGDDMADLAVLRVARRAFLVRPSRELLEAARATCRVERVFD